jgi:HPt (histidine-containing phosphotransfer) domain-containing protein
MSPDESVSLEPIRSVFADDPDFRDLLVEFAAAMPERRDGLIGAHRSGEYDLLRTRAHQLKGAGGGFGFPQLTELAAALEKACIAQEPVGIVDALERVVGYLNQITV